MHPTTRRGRAVATMATSSCHPLDDTYLRSSEVSQILNVPVGTLKIWRHRGQGPRWIRLEGDRGQVRYPKSGVEAYLRAKLEEQHDIA